MSGRPRIDAHAPGDTIEDAFRLVSVTRTSPPDGTVGNDWHVYRIAQGPNMMTGYRRGTAANVTAEVELIVTGLNDRRIPRYGRANQKTPRPVTATEPAEPAKGDAET